MNSNYISNKVSLQPATFFKLPVRAVKSDGWLNVFLVQQAIILTGNLNQISVWLEKKDISWLDHKGRGKCKWEEEPYWLNDSKHFNLYLRKFSIL